jgi:hypothetical protein
MALGQCSDADVKRAHAAGIRLFMSGDCPSVPATDQLEMVQDRGLAVLPVAASGVRGEAPAGWTFFDEPREQPLVAERARPGSPVPACDA